MTLRLEEIPVNQIEANKEQHRDIDDASLKRLAHNIKLHGLIEPIVVRDKNGHKNFTLACGEQRWNAVKSLSWKKIPARILDKDTSDDKLPEMALCENLVREDLTAMQREELCFKRKNKGGYGTNKKFAEVVGGGQVSEQWVGRMLTAFPKRQLYPDWRNTTKHLSTENIITLSEYGEKARVLLAKAMEYKIIPSTNKKLKRFLKQNYNDLSDEDKKKYQENLKEEIKKSEKSKVKRGKYVEEDKDDDNKNNNKIQEMKAPDTVKKVNKIVDDAHDRLKLIDANIVMNFDKKEKRAIINTMCNTIFIISHILYGLGKFKYKRYEEILKLIDAKPSDLEQVVGVNDKES